MKVVFVQPPIEDFYATRIRNYPLGLLYLATKVKDLCEVKVIDLRKWGKPRKSQNPFPQLSEYYREDVYSPFSLFRRYARYGAKEAEIEEMIRSEMPDVLCISSLFSAYAHEALEVARCGKKVNEGIITVAGGHHATSIPDFFLKEKYVDYVIRGEGETPLYNLLVSLLKKRSSKPDGIAGLCFRDKYGIRISDTINYETDIDIIPDRDLIKKEDYRIGRKSYSFVLTSRGCPNFCAFCSKMPIPYRERSLNSIEEEIEKLKRQGIEWVDFEDDMLVRDEGRFFSILHLLKGKNLVLSAMNGIYVESLSDRMLKEMIEAGFKKVNLSLVDLSPFVLRGQRRQIPKNLSEILSWIESSELLMEIHFIVGLPNQGVEDVLKTMSYLSERRCLIGPSVYYLSPGNPLVKDVLGKNWVQRIRYMRSSVLLPAGSNFSRKSLYTLVKLARFINFLKRFVDEKEGNFSLTEIRLSSPIDDEILRTLIKEKRFIAYDTVKHDFIEESHERGIVEQFFSTMEKKKVKGYKTPYSVEFRIR